MAFYILLQVVCMRNLVKLALVSSLLSSMAFADGAFVGVESDYSFGSKFKVKLEDGGNDKFKKPQAGLGIKVGYDFGIYRIYGAYGYDFKTSKGGSKSDGYWKNECKKHKFLVGAYTGLSRLSANNPWTDVKDGVVTDGGNDKFNKTGFVVGSKIGGIYEIDVNNVT